MSQDVNRGDFFWKTLDNLAGRKQVLASQGIVNPAPEVPFNLKVANLPNSYLQLPKDEKVAKRSSASPVWFEPSAKEDELGNANLV